MNKATKRCCVVLLIAIAILATCCFCSCRNGNKKKIAVFNDDSSDITYKDIEKKDGIIATEDFVIRNLEVIDEFCKDNQRTVLITDTSNSLFLALAYKYLGFDEESGYLVVAPICVVRELYEQEFDIEDIFYDETVLNYKSRIDELESGVKYQPYFIRLYAQNENAENIYVGTVCSEMIIERKSTDDKIYDSIDMNYNLSISMNEGYNIESFDLITLYDGDFYLDSVEQDIKVNPDNISADLSDGFDTLSSSDRKDYVCSVKTQSAVSTCSIKINRVYKYLKSCKLDNYKFAFTNLKLSTDSEALEFSEKMSPHFLCMLLCDDDESYWLGTADLFDILFPNE